jgi:hypothetical protein
MAVTPRSFLRSPTLLVALIISAGMALFGATLFLWTFSGGQPEGCHRTVAIADIDPVASLRGGGCDHLLRDHGSALTTWQHDDWVNLATCFEGQSDHRRAASTAAQGLFYYPVSERLHNIGGYNLIVLEEYDEAVIRLRVALQSVTPTDGVLENNLAWAGLFASDRMTLSEARRHIQNSLDRGGSCEAYHTGMWVEYAVASRSSGATRDDAIAAYSQLRANYEPCTSRVDRSGDRTTAYEVAGAGILDGEIYKLTMVQAFERNQIDEGFPAYRSDLVGRSIGAMNISRTEIDSACEDIAPVRGALPACRKALSSAMCAH